MSVPISAYTAVTRLAVAGCTEAEIATITGHSLPDVGAIPDAHYLHRDPALAESAIRKLERGTKTPSQPSPVLQRHWAKNSTKSAGWGTRIRT
jgi:hypothetical protein